MNRRGFLAGMAGILASGIAPLILPRHVITSARAIWVPEKEFFSFTEICNLSEWAKRETERVCGIPPPYVSVIPHDPRQQLLADNMALHINRTLQRSGAPFLSYDFVYEDAKRKLIAEAETILNEVRRGKT